MLSVNQEIVAQIKSIYGEDSNQVSGMNSLMSAAASNDVDGVRFFSKGGASLINQKNIGGATALHIASREGNFEIAQLLVDGGADVNITDNEGWTPLMRASLAGSYEIVGLLLSKNADASLVNSVNESAITGASSSDCGECLKQMFEKFNFIKMMDEDLLKNQINEAFVIARNHENKTIQEILEQYLDQVVKMSMLAKPQMVDEDLGAISISEKSKLDLVTKSKKEEVYEYDLGPEKAPSGSKKIGKVNGKFKFVGSVEGEKETPNSISESPNKFKVISSVKQNKDVVMPSKESDKKDNGSVFLQNSKVNDKSVTEILKSKKFRFYKGPSSQPSFKFDDSKQLQEEAKKAALVEKEEVAPIPPIVNSFKLIKGPSAEIVKSDKIDNTTETKQGDEKISVPTTVIPLSLDNDKAIAKIGEALDQSSSAIVTETVETKKKKSFKLFQGPSTEKSNKN